MFTLTSTGAEEAEQSAQAMRTLEQELDLLRGVGGLGVPALDYEVEVASMAQAPVAGHKPTSELHVPSYDSSQLEREPELPSVVDELDSAQLRLVEELESQRLRRDREARAGLQEELRRQEGTVREERDALLAYLDELRGRDDEAGSEIRGDGFGRRVEELAAEEQSRRGVAEAQQGFAQLAAITDDPKLREQLLEVQRLDDLLSREAEAAQAGEPTDGVESGSGVGGGSSVEGGSSAAGGGGVPAVTSSRLSTADLARLDRILDEGGEPADNPYEAAGARMHEVEAQLQQLQQLHAPWDPLRGPPPPEPAAAEGGEEEPARGKLGGRKKDKEQRRERKAPPGLLVAPADHLTELKEERAEAQHLQQVKAQLAALAATPASQPPTEAEAAALVPLMAQLRTEALSRCSESAISIN